MYLGDSMFIFYFLGVLQASEEMAAVTVAVLVASGIAILTALLICRRRHIKGS